MLKGSPFCIQTNLGKLQLTKGTFLTLQRRNFVSLRTIAKSKAINKLTNKFTVKHSRQTSLLKNIQYKSIRLLNGQGQAIKFAVMNQNDRLKWKDCKSLPTIEMICDNDDDSEWTEIEDCITNLSLSLSLAAFDNKMKN